MQVGTVCTYTPTDAEQPMANGQPQAALVTGWNEETSLAGLIVFPAHGDYGYHKDNVLEGTDPGTFQQLSTAPPAAAKEGDKPAAEAATHHTGIFHKNKDK